MTVVSETGQKIPLGVGTIIGDSFSILFGNFFKVLVLAFIANFAGFLVSGLLFGFAFAAGLTEPAFIGVGAALAPLVVIVINVAVYGLTIGVLVQLAYDAKLGRSNSLGTYFRSALPGIVPILVLSLVVIVLALIGVFALLVGAFWVYAVFYVIIPAIVIERAGFGAMVRSAALTKEYRWPIVGLLMVVVIITLVIGLVSAFIQGAADFALPSSTAAAFGIGVVSMLISGLSYGYGGIAIALVYARLREIKEGVDVDQIAAVFD